MKKFLIILLAAVMAICAFSLPKILSKSDTTVITALSVKDVKEKIHTDDYYLTVLLDDFVVQEYGLSYNSLKLKTTESIYNQIKPGSGFSGVSLKITIPENQEKRDLGMVLKEKLSDWCLIIGITTKDNKIID